MSWYLGWRKRLPGGFNIGWRRRLGTTRGRFGFGCLGLLLSVCCLGACVTALPKAATATPAIAGTATLAAASTRAQPSTTLQASATAQASATQLPATLAVSATENTQATAANTATQAASPSATKKPVVQATATKKPVAQPTITNKPAAQPSNTPQPAQSTATQEIAATATSAPAGITLVSVTSPISKGSNASLVIQTTAGASCSLSYTTPKGNTSTAAGLGATTAGSDGHCGWSWKISTSTDPGTGKLFVSANGAHASFDIVIQ